MNSSLFYEIFMYLNSFYFGMFAFSELSIVNESCFLFGICVLEISRIILGRKGSLSEYSWKVYLSVVLTIPSLCGVLYFLLYQTYILKLEYIICALLVALHAAEIMFALVFFVTLCRPSEYYNT
uniref:Transmembrane protein 216 n=1 Tax=Megaselia scalaris TaxID=36166 RepID=T1H2M4_MEGSC